MWVLLQKFALPEHENYSAVTQGTWQKAQRHEPDLQTPHNPARFNIHGMRQQNKQNGLQQLQVSNGFFYVICIQERRLCDSENFSGCLLVWLKTITTKSCAWILRRRRKNLYCSTMGKCAFLQWQFFRKLLITGRGTKKHQRSKGFDFKAIYYFTFIAVVCYHRVFSWFSCKYSEWWI